MEHEARGQLAVFGGAFDPFHNGHVAAIKLLLSIQDIAKVLVVPSGDRPDKRGISSAASRYEMARLGVAQSFPDEERVEVSDLQSSGIVGFSTIDLIEHLNQKEVSIVIGGELLADLPNWHRATDLKKVANFLVLQRPGVTEPVTVPFGWRVKLLPQFSSGGVNVSSTEIRSRLAKGEPCDGLLPSSVVEFLRRSGNPRSY